MTLVDMNDNRVYTLSDLKADWETFKDEDPDNHASDFTTEFFEILMATVNGRNDLEIVGPTPGEVGNYINSLRTRIWNRNRWGD